MVLDADGLAPAQMQCIAREINLSETAFVMASATADFRARYFTPAEEIPLAGHPTLATLRALMAAGRLPERAATIRLQLEAGVVRVEIQPGDEGTRITMCQLPPRFLSEHDPEAVMPAFGLAAADLLPGARILTVSTGTPQLMVPLASKASLRRAGLRPEAYAELRLRSDFFSPHLFVLEGVTQRGATFSRHFGVPPDTMEDPFTGSATGGMGAYLWRERLIEAPAFVAEQGHWMGRPGEARVEVVGPRDAISGVRVGGYAVELMRGTIRVPC